jgi:hypothetical protein
MVHPKLIFSNNLAAVMYRIYDTYTIDKRELRTKFYLNSTPITAYTYV